MSTREVSRIAGRPSRRAFTGWLVAATTSAASGALARPFGYSPRPVRIAGIAEVTLAAMRPWVNRRFRITGPGGDGFLELLEATALPRHQDGRAERFSLSFRSATSASPTAGLWRFSHPVAGTFELFITPIGPPDPTGPRYEAIINRESPA